MRIGLYQAISTPIRLPQAIASPSPAAPRVIEATPLVHRSPLEARSYQAIATLSSAGKADIGTRPVRVSASQPAASSSNGM